MKIFKQSLLNTYSAADVNTSSTPGMIVITGLDWIPVSEKILYNATTDRKDPVAEVDQIVQIGVAVPPVISAATKYQVKIGNTGNRREGAQSQLFAFGSTSPAILTGNAATDRYNVYNDLATKINNNYSDLVVARTEFSITHATGAFTVGDVVTGATSGATAIVVSDAANLLVADLNGTTNFISGENITDQHANTFASTAAPTLGLGLVIYDVPGYFPSRGGRTGANQVLATLGFLPSMAVITTAAVIGFGQGTRMLSDYPVKEATSDNLASGIWDGNTGANQPIAGASYRLFVIRSTKPLNGEFALNNQPAAQVIQYVWVNTASGNLAAFTAAIAAI